MADGIDTQAILARRREFVRLALGGVAAAAVATACAAPCLSVARPLVRGGLFVARVDDHGARAGLRHGDLIQSIDGIPVSTPEALATALLDGQPHLLTLGEADALSRELELRVEGERLPFIVIDAALLARTPHWARRRLFGHALPELGLVTAKGGEALSAELLEGRRWLIALVDWVSAEDRVHAGLILQVMQKAQADLREAGVSLVYARVAHPSAHRAPEDLELTSFMVGNQVRASEGGPLPLLPAYVQTDATRRQPTAALERIGEAPNLLILDERGVVRWHSAGATPDPSGEIVLAMVYTTVEAVLFARDALSVPDARAPGSRTRPASPASG